MKNKPTFKHDDIIRCKSGRYTDGSFEWKNSDKHQDGFDRIPIRIIKDMSNQDQLLIGIEDFNLNYPQDVFQETEEFVIIQFFGYAFYIQKDGKEFDVSELYSQEKQIDQVIEEIKEVKLEELVSSNGKADNTLSELISMLKSLNVKSVTFKDGTIMEII